MYYISYKTRDNYINFLVLIQGNKKTIQIVRGVPGGGAEFLFALLLEIGRSNLNSKIFILIKKFKKIFCCQGRPREGQNFHFLYHL